MSVHAVFGARFVAGVAIASVLALAGCTSSAGSSPGQAAGTAAAGASVAPATETGAAAPSAVVPVIAVKPSATSQLTVDCDAFAAQAKRSGDVHLKSGDVLAITLCSNGSTGFSWEQPRIEGDALSLFGTPGTTGADATVPPLGAAPTAVTAASAVTGTNPATVEAQGPVGAASTTTFLLKADHSGTSTVSFLYSRPWAGGEKGVWQYTLRATVDAAASELTVGCDAFAANAKASAEVHIKAGDTLSVTLCSNGSTGFSWELPKIAGNALSASGTSTGAAAAGVVGAPSSTTFLFTANHRGATKVSFAYSRPWAGGEKGVWQYTLTVTVD